MTREQRITALMLGKCRFLPGSFDKRFARSMRDIALYKPAQELTEKQAECLVKMAGRYRRQMAGVPIPTVEEVG